MSNKGYFMKKTKPTDIKEAVWWEEYCIRRQGGYDLDQSNLPRELKWLPKGTVLKLSATGGNAVAVKTATVTEKAAQGATTLKIATGSLVQVGDTIGGAKVTAITTGDTYDTLTVEALADAIEAKTVISDYDAENDTLLGFSYDTLDLDSEASIPATPTLQVMEVDEETLPYPINADIKTGLNANGVALFKIQ